MIILFPFHDFISPALVRRQLRPGQCGFRNDCLSFVRRWHKISLVAEDRTRQGNGKVPKSTRSLDIVHSEVLVGDPGEFTNAGAQFLGGFDTDIH